MNYLKFSKLEKDKPDLHKQPLTLTTLIFTPDSRLNQHRKVLGGKLLSLAPPMTWERGKQVE